MKPFAFTRATDAAGAVETVSREKAAMFLGGGTNLIDLRKEGVEQPDRLVDINRLPLEKIEQTAGGLRIGALARNSDTANHPLRAGAVSARRAAGAARGGVAAASQPGDDRRKPDAKNPLFLFLRYGDAVQ